MRAQNQAKAVTVASPGSTPRRNEDGLGEPEGSASPDSPLARWTKSLHFLLGDQDGAHLFRTFLEREKCVDTLDFWFACNGFRQMDLNDTKTLRVAKAIFKRYIENNSIVAKQLKPATKTYIRDSIKKQQIDSAMFDQAQTEIQSTMEENAYQMFLTSDIYLEYVHTGCENTVYANHSGLGSLKLMCGFLPPLIEEEEWSCDLKATTLASVVGLSANALRATASIRTAAEVLENGYRSHRRGDPASPYFVNSGYVFAPATSANDSEISSDAMTDDSMSMTDSSVDGIPPYKLGTKKQIQREMHRSVKINGLVSLPHFPVSPASCFLMSAVFIHSVFISLKLHKLFSIPVYNRFPFSPGGTVFSSPSFYDVSTPKTLPGRTHSSWGVVGGVGGHLRGGHHPAHPFIQDPAMPPLPPPNTLAQLEEACRRLEEVSKPPKQRHSTSSLQRDRSHPLPFPSGYPPLISPALQTDEWKEPKKSISGASVSGCDLVVTYFFCGEEIPYRSMMKTHSLTLGHFKEQLSKKGNYRYYFKKASDEFECGAVFEEVWEDGALLPMYEGKVLGKVERMD
nr:axin-2-like [Oncorhynchus nerka]